MIITEHEPSKERRNQKSYHLLGLKLKLNRRREKSLGENTYDRKTFQLKIIKKIIIIIVITITIIIIVIRKVMKK